MAVGPESAPWRPDWTDDEHARAVAEVQTRGRRDLPVQPDRPAARSLAGHPQELYARLALAQRGAYNAYLDLGRHVVASASPELFFEWTGDRLSGRAR